MNIVTVGSLDKYAVSGQSLPYIRICQCSSCPDTRFSIRSGYVGLDGTQYQTVDSGYLSIPNSIVDANTGAVRSNANIMFGVQHPHFGTDADGKLYIAIYGWPSFTGKKFIKCATNQYDLGELQDTVVVHYVNEAASGCTSGYGIFAQYRIGIWLAYLQQGVLYTRAAVVYK